MNPKSGRVAQFYLCNGCQEEFPQKDVEVDHIDPVVSPAQGFESWDLFINNLFCEAENLQVLCKTCHTAKSKKERDERVGKVRDGGGRVEKSPKRKAMYLDNHKAKTLKEKKKRNENQPND